MMSIRSIRTLLTGAAALALLAVAQPAHALNFANFNQNPATPPSAGFSIASGVNNFVGTSIPIDYTFLVPPNNATAFVAPGSLGTAKALMNITGGGLVANTAVVGGGGNITQNVDFTFSIVSSNGPLAANTNLLTGRLVGVLNVAGINLTQATMNCIGLSSTSTVLYDVGGGPMTAEFLATYTASWTLDSATSPITVSGGQITSNSFGGMTGGFAGGLVPEPASIVLLGLGVLGIPAVGLIRRRVARA